MDVPKLYYRSDPKTVGGPLLPIEIDNQIRSNKVPANLLVCDEGHDVWTDLASWPKPKFPNALCAFSLGTIVARLRASYQLSPLPKLAEFHFPNSIRV